MNRNRKLFWLPKRARDEDLNISNPVPTLKLDELYRVDSTSSVDTNATAANLPGPGRTVGILLDTLGAGLENVINKIAVRHGPSFQSPYAQWNEEGHDRDDFIFSIDSDATASNLIGAGRTVGLLFDSLGDRLEQFVNRMAERRGAGPSVVSRHIRQIRHHRVTRLHERYIEQMCVSEERTLKKLCKKLLKYSRCATAPSLLIQIIGLKCLNRARLLETQLKALEEITALAVSDPLIRRVLDTYRVEEYLSPKYSEPQLRLASAKALISVKNIEVHEVWSRFQHLTIISSPSSRPVHNRDEEIARLSKNIRILVKYVTITTQAFVH